MTHLELKKQLEVRPFEMVGGAVMSGFLVGALLTSKKASLLSRLAIIGQLAGLFKEEAEMLKEIFVSSVEDKVSQYVSVRLPSLAADLKPIIHSAASKVKGNPEFTKSRAPLRSVSKEPQEKLWRPGAETARR